MTFDELKKKANSLPLEPGVYIMRDKDDTVIYVGKAKRLKNRVSSYFLDTAAHSIKTRTMVQKIHHFEVIVAASEFEALVLECSLIKRHAPRYNILLKDDKGYPYLRLDMHDPYPGITIANKVQNDGAEYFGPYGSRGTTNALLEAIYHTLKLPGCSKKFPRDIGKGRPCLNYHMNQCAGWCQNGLTSVQYRAAIEQARQLLLGNYKKVAESIKNEMLSASEDLNFEQAACLRDRLKAVEALGQKQLVTAGRLADTDVIGYAQTETKACFTVLHFAKGSLLDKDYEVFSLPDTAEDAVSSLLKQYYLGRGFSPKMVLLPFSITDHELIEQLLEQNFGRKVRLHVPQRGDNVRLVELACKNALEEVQRVTTKEERISGVLSLLGKMLSMEPPSRIESYDISNISGTDIVGSMVVFCDGKPAKSQYKKFKIKDMPNQDDYGSMRQMLRRRLEHYIAKDKGFEAKPDLLLIDGGAVHAAAVREILSELQLDFPVFGMVKDDRHRTRALVTPQDDIIAIDGQQSVFAFIGTIQEETHRFAICYHKKLRSKRLRYSRLDEIPGIGPKRKQELLRRFKSISAISDASVAELRQILPQDAANAVFEFFNNAKERE